MPINPKPALIVAAIALLVSVATQIVYVGLEASGTALATNLWRAECIAFLALALAGGALIGARPWLGAGLAIGGLLNVAQAGMGLVMFGPLREAGEGLGPVFQAVLGMAFFLYFAGKAAIALAAIVLGLQQWNGAMGVARIIGGLTLITGVAALAVNAAAMVSGMALTFAAGATGTAAALLLGLALLTVKDAQGQLQA